MEGKLDQAIKEYHDKEHSLSEAEIPVVNLQEKADRLKRQAQQGQKRLSALEARRKRLIKAVALGEANSDELTEVKRKKKETQEQIEEFQEMVVAVKASISVAKEAVLAAEYELEASCRQYWKTAHEAAIEEFEATMEPLLKAFFTAQICRSGHPRFDEWFQRLASKRRWTIKADKYHFEEDVPIREKKSHLLCADDRNRGVVL